LKKNGTQFWSGTANHCPIPDCEAVVVTTTVPVLDTNEVPQTDLPVYVYNGGTYTGFSKMTSAGGQAVFTLPVGDYRFRTDQSGVQYWSGSQNHCTIPGCTSAGMTLPAPLGILDSQGLAFFQPEPGTLSVSTEQIFPVCQFSGR